MRFTRVRYSLAHITPHAFSPGTPSILGRPAPTPMNTASKPRSPSSSSTVKVRPATMLVSTRTPSASRASSSRATTALGRRNSGMPYTSTPPRRNSESKMVTSTPARANSKAQVMPAGPLPTTATRHGAAASASAAPASGAPESAAASPASSSALSPRKRSSWPMAMGLPRLASTQAPSHCVSCGHTRPHTLGSRLSRRTTSRPRSQSRARMASMKWGMSTPTGQPCTHAGRAQSRQRFASSTASSSV